MLVGSVLTAQGQTPAAGQGGADMDVNIKSLVSGLPASLPTGSVELKGSPYAFARWLPAHITLNNKVKLAPLPLKYDILNQRLLMRENFTTRDSLRLDDRQVAGFVLDEPTTPLSAARTRTFQRFSDAADARNRAAYVEVLHQGRYTLLKQYLKTVHKADYQNAYGNGNRFDEVEDKVQYYVRSPDARVVPVKLNMKSIAAAAPDLAATLKKSPPAAETEDGWIAALNAADPK